ncbi:MAG: metal-sensitive transcriptional regulator [Ottowia sp.]|nr:metal-sensitive transcriptional regulator [Ottowia sp.]
MDAETNKARKKALCARLARIEGQVRGLQKLINQQAEPEKISQQMAAARKALDKAFFAMVADLMASDQITPTDAADLLLRFA